MAQLGGARTLREDIAIRDLHPIRTHGKRKRQLDDVVRRNLYLVYLDLEHMVSTRCRFALAHFTSRLPTCLPGQVVAFSPGVAVEF